jgi:2',3'-cyclic-nucleotide 2'-phosphodiesterase (5'-nucleotidase family)
MNTLGYDAMTLGNHDFDQGTENVERLVDVAEFPVLGANLRHADGRPYADQPGQVFHFGDVSVGIVGVVTEALDNLLPLRVLEDVRVDPVAESVRAWIASLEERPDVLIALTHQGVEEDEALAAAVPELDLILGGHSHTRIDEPRSVGTTRIVQAGSRMRELGRVRFEVEDGKIVSIESDLLPLFATGISTDEALARVVAGHEARIEEVYGEVIGEAAVRLDRRGNASSLGIWLAEALADGSGADFGLMNNGGIRANLDAGPITRGDVFAVLPFHNYVTTFELSGSDLLQVLQRHAERAATRSRGGIQIGYLTARWKKTGDDVVLAEATCRGRAIDPDQTYRGVSADFVVVSQADAYLGVTPKNVTTTSELLATLVEKVIRDGGAVSGRADDRFDEADERP